MLRLARYLLFVFLLLLAMLAYAQAPAILLAQIYHDDIRVQEYLVSEKLDGIRAIWDGYQFTSRQGHPIHAPAWFTEHFPTRPMDGELWIGRGQFETLSSTVRQTQPSDAAWRQVAYYVFELPEVDGDFSQRAQQMVQITRQAHSPYLKSLPQFRVKDRQVLKRTLDHIVAQRGEGLMLHRADAPYLTGRSHVLLKLKLDFTRSARQIIMSKTERSKLHERYQIHG